MRETGRNGRERVQKRCNSKGPPQDRAKHGAPWSFRGVRGSEGVSKRGALFSDIFNCLLSDALFRIPYLSFLSTFSADCSAGLAMLRNSHTFAPPEALKSKRTRLPSPSEPAPICSKGVLPCLLTPTYGNMVSMAPLFSLPLLEIPGLRGTAMCPRIWRCRQGGGITVSNSSMKEPASLRFPCYVPSMHPALIPHSLTPSRP